ncbi:MAG: hypothetical protein EOO40_01235, partial [Deltaproteobacteria bacterium]
VQTGQVLIDADQKQNRELRQVINEQTVAAVSQRKTVSELKSDLGHAIEDWTRDLHRIAATEKHAASEAGKADYFAKTNGADSQVAIISAPDCCFIPGTPVITQRGNIPIEQVRVGDFALTHKLRWRKVTRTMERHYAGEIYGINGKPIATSEHPYLVNFNWRPVQSIKPGDQIIEVIASTDANYQPTPVSDVLVPLKVSVAHSTRCVPITPVKLYSYLQRRESEISVIATDSIFRDATPVGHSLYNMPGFLGHMATRFLTSAGGFALSLFAAKLATLGTGISSKGFPLRRGMSSTGISAGRAGVSAKKARSGQNTLDASGRHPELSGDRFERAVRRVVGSDDCADVKSSLFQTGRHCARPINVENIAQVKYDGPVFNLEIQGDHTYIANGQIVHNCEACAYLTRGADGAPRIFTLSQLEANGSNYGRKAADLRAVIGPIHPNCQCAVVPVPKGWGFDASHELVPDGTLGEHSHAGELARSENAQPDLRKAQHHMPHTAFLSGVAIHIDQPAWSAAVPYATGTLRRGREAIKCLLGQHGQTTQVAYVAHDAAGDKLLMGFESREDAVLAYTLDKSCRSVAPPRLSEVPMSAVAPWAAEAAPPVMQLRRAFADDGTVVDVTDVDGSDALSQAPTLGAGSLGANFAFKVPVKKRSVERSPQDPTGVVAGIKHPTDDVAVNPLRRKKEAYEISTRMPKRSVHARHYATPPYTPKQRRNAVATARTGAEAQLKARYSGWIGPEQTFIVRDLAGILTHKTPAQRKPVTKQTPRQRRKL